MKRAFLSLSFILFGALVIVKVSLPNVKKSEQEITLQIQTTQTPSPTPTQIPTKLIQEEQPRDIPLIYKPDKNKTPGDSIKDIPLDLLCMKGYTETVRNVSKTTKKNVYELYGISYPPAENTFVIDHLIPLELGGSNSIKNLWPQSVIDSSQSAKMKDKVENLLHSKVCEGSLNLSEAQSIMTTDWDIWYNTYIEKP